MSPSLSAAMKSVKYILNEVYFIKPNFCTRPETGSCLFMSQCFWRKQFAMDSPRIPLSPKLNPNILPPLLL